MLFFSWKNPTEPCNQDRETLRCKAESYLTLYCSQRPAPTVETSQSRIGEGGLQTTFDLIFGLLFLFVGFLCPSSQIKQASHLSFEKGVPKNFISVKFSKIFFYMSGEPPFVGVHTLRDTFER